MGLTSVTHIFSSKFHRPGPQQCLPFGKNKKTNIKPLAFSCEAVTASQAMATPLNNQTWTQHIICDVTQWFKQCFHWCHWATVLYLVWKQPLYLMSAAISAQDKWPDFSADTLYVQINSAYIDWWNQSSIVIAVCTWFLQLKTHWSCHSINSCNELNIPPQSVSYSVWSHAPRVAKED